MEDDGEQERLPRKKETSKVREQWVGIYVELKLTNLQQNVC